MKSGYVNPLRQFMRGLSPLVAGILLLAANLAAGDDRSPLLLQAEARFLKGRYAEAHELFSQAAAEHPVPAAYGEAHCWRALGDSTAAIGILEGVLEERAAAHALRTLLAEMMFSRGDYPAVEEELRQLQAAEYESAATLWLAGEHAYASGELERAEAYYRAAAEQAKPPEGEPDLITCYNLLAAGQAMERLAQWDGAKEPYRTLVQQFYPALVARRADFWPAHLEMARLLAGKYNTPGSLAAMNKALAGNASAGEIYLLRARLAIDEFDLPAARRDISRALALNPELLEGYLLLADCSLAEFQFEEALAALEKGRNINPLHESLLGRLAAAYRARDGAQPNEPNSAWRRIEEEVLARNAHCGEFYRSVGDTLDRMRKYPQAVKFYRRAAEVMPQRAHVNAQLGMLAMRLGEESRARALLTAAFETDPFNLRVKNTLEVLEVLQGYALLETEHFLLRFDRGHDAVMAEAAAEYLEEVVYPLLVERLGYEPPEKSLIEVFSRARNSSGHAWFSARMVGLPFIGTVGACAGKMAAIVSPSDGRTFHWARVLRHEFVHVVNLQQTDFNIPHWYTEALAVWNEDRPRPREWQAILAARHRADALFTLDTINMGFIRPGSSDNWTLAYCQAELYAEYLVERFGEKALGAMLAAYRENLTTAEALEECFSIKQAEFERGYREYLAGVVARESPAALPTITIEQAAAAVEAKPGEAHLHAQLALANLSEGNLAEAKDTAAAALKLDAHEPLALYVVAALLVKVDRTESARELLAKRLKEDRPEAHSLWLQGQSAVQAGDWAAAEEAYRRGYAALPQARPWLTALAQVIAKTGDQTDRLWLLQELAELREDDFSLREEIVTVAEELGEQSIAGRWAEDACYINPNSPELWATAARWHTLEGRHAKAARRYRWALMLDANRDDYRLSMIAAMVQNQEYEAAAGELAPLAERLPNHAEVIRLQEEIKRGGTDQSE